ncbi:MAG: hypothetical protein ABW066_15195 [Sedimenticola sp.]
MRLRQQGFAIVLVIWALLLLTTIAASFAYSVRVETMGGIGLTDRVNAEAIANAALHRTVFGLLVKDRKQAWVADGRVYEIPWPDTKVSVRIRSESGKVDLNYAPRELLEGLFETLLEDYDTTALAAAVIDWRDKDTRPLPEGAEVEEYLRAGRRHGPPNSHFTTLSELAQVMGFDGTSMEILRPHITIHSRRAKLDATVASPLVLAVIPGIDRATAEEFVETRRQRLDAGLPIDLTELGTGARHLESRARATALAIETDVELPNGHKVREQTVIRLMAKGNRFEYLDWRSLPLDDSEHFTGSDE